MIVVNSSTRQFSIPGADLVFGVESDSGSERKYFQCPRYVGNNLDIAGSFVRINYRNANGEIDSYLVEDLTVDGDNVTFSWLLTPKVTMYKGQVKFVMCVVGADLKVKWHTTQGTGQVLEGLEPEIDVESETADVVAQLITMVENQTATVEAEGAKQIKAVQTAAKTAESDAVAEIEAKGVNVRESIPDDYATLSEAVDGVVRGRAGAIVCSVEGSAVSVTDSSNLPMQGMRIFGRSTQDGTPTPEAPVEIKSVEKPVVTVCGKNLFHLGTFSGTQSSWNEVSFPAGEYTFSAIATSNDTDSTTCLVLVYEDRQKLVEKRFSRGVRESLTFTVTGTLTHIILYASNTNNNSAGDTFEFADTMLEVNSEATAYDPYKTPQTLPITHTLPGIPVTSGGNYTDSDGQHWICDEVDLERGVYVQRILNAVFDGSDDEGWRRDYTSDDTKRRMVTSLLSEAIKKVENNRVANVFCNLFVKARADDTYSLLERVSIDDLGRIHIYSNTYNNMVEDWISFLASNNMTMLCELAHPTETPLSETEIAAYRALHSNYPNTTVLNDSGAHMVVKYAADTKLYIDNKIKEALQ